MADTSEVDLKAEVERLRAEVARLTEAIAELEVDETAMVESLMAKRLPSVERGEGVLARADALLAKYPAPSASGRYLPPLLNILVEAEIPIAEDDAAISARLLGDDAKHRPLSQPDPLPEPDNTAQGCNACEHATRRFNGGHSATTCDLLGGRIVATGSTPTTRPSACPLPKPATEPPAWERKPVTHDWMYVDHYERAGELVGWTIGEGNVVDGDWCMAVSRPIEPSKREESKR